MASVTALANVRAWLDTIACSGLADGTKKRFGAGSGTPPGSAAGERAGARK
ncbi:MAG: hypothetical protein HY899_09680 [Deltaproteobacteria bacterium]|nr:hypothetical protein [Deltaproteobacteria bacterium]